MMMMYPWFVRDRVERFSDLQLPTTLLKAFALLSFVCKGCIGKQNDVAVDPNDS